jgi:hypothetical protein
MKYAVEMGFGLSPPSGILEARKQGGTSTLLGPLFPPVRWCLRTWFVR